MRPAEFDIERPHNLDEALQRLQHAAPGAAILAGGQALLKQLRERSIAPPVLVDISQLGELIYIERVAGRLEIGALTTLATLAADSVASRHCAALVEAAAKVGDVQIRARGTLGGNVLSGWSSDLAVVLAALDARAELVAVSGAREIAVAELVACGCRPGELLRSVSLPPTFGSAFEKLMRRSADPVIVSAAACVWQDAGAERYGLAVGGVHTHALRLPTIESLLAEGERDARALAAGLDVVTRALAPPDTPHASASYRRRVLPVIALRALSRALAAAGLGELA